MSTHSLTSTVYAEAAVGAMVTARDYILERNLCVEAVLRANRDLDFLPF